MPGGSPQLASAPPGQPSASPRPPIETESRRQDAGGPAAKAVDAWPTSARARDGDSRALGANGGGAGASSDTDAAMASPGTPAITQPRRPRAAAAWEGRAPASPPLAPVREEDPRDLAAELGGARRGTAIPLDLGAAAAMSGASRSSSASPSGSAGAEADRWPVGLIRLYHPGLASDAEEEVAQMEGRWVVTVPSGREERKVAAGGWQPGQELVSDGAAVFWARRSDLYDEELEPGEVARVLSSLQASPSPRCESTASATWSWCTPAGLLEAPTTTVTVAQSAVPHLLGRGGRVARRVEEKLGVIMGIMDGTRGGSATVTLCGPPSHLEPAKVVIKMLEKGMRSILDRLPRFV